MTQRYAAFDIGTVTCRALVADASATEFETLYKGYGITNLGEGVDATGRLKPEAIDRVLAQIDEYLTVVEGLKDAEHSEIQVVAMATSAARDAENSQDLVGQLEARGVSLKVIPGSREAALTFLGASQAYQGESILVVDIGGGSTELVAGVGGREPQHSFSFNIGCRRVTEKFLSLDPPDAAQMAQAKEWMSAQFSTFFDELRQQGISVDKIVAVAGTATTVVSVREKMEVYDSSRVQGARVSAEDLQQVKSMFESVGLEERKAIVGLDPGRAPVIVAGMLILQTVLELAGKDCYYASESDILQGIILSEVAQG